jgi:stage V sporulation protein SpoVS
MEVIKVRRATDPHLIAGAIAKAIRRTAPEGVAVEVRAIGPDAVYQAIRAIATAASYLASDDAAKQLTNAIRQEAIPGEQTAERDTIGTIFRLDWKAGT